MEPTLCIALAFSMATTVAILLSSYTQVEFLNGIMTLSWLDHKQVLWILFDLLGTDPPDDEMRLHVHLAP